VDSTYIVLLGIYSGVSMPKIINSVEIAQSYINLTSSKWKCAVFLAHPVDCFPSATLKIVALILTVFCMCYSKVSSKDLTTDLMLTTICMYKDYLPTKIEVTLVVFVKE